MDAINEIEQKQRGERIQIQKDAEVLATLVMHPGWARYIALVESVAQNYHATIMKPLDNIFEAGRLEYAKGALTGLSLATSLPGMKVREADELRKQRQED